MRPVRLTADCSMPVERRQNDLSPRVDRLTGGTIRVAVADERMWSVHRCGTVSALEHATSGDRAGAG